jgi:hypothetical protein
MGAVKIQRCPGALAPIFLKKTPAMCQSTAGAFLRTIQPRKDYNADSGIVYFPNWLICGKSQYRYLWFFNTLWIALQATRNEPNSLKSARSSSAHTSRAIKPKASASIAALRTSPYLALARSHCAM